MRVSIFLVLSACVSENRPTDMAMAVVDESEELSVGFDRRAYYVKSDAEGRPFIEQATTHDPVLGFFGKNSDGSAIAYTSLGRVRAGTVQGRAAITLNESLELTLDDLVPTGELVVEMAGQANRVSLSGEFVTFATWSPTDPDILAYGYHSDFARGIAVVDVKNGNRTASFDGDFVTDYFMWSDDAERLLAYASDQSEPDTAAENAEHVEDQYLIRTAHVLDVRDGRVGYDEGLTALNGAFRLSSEDEDMEIVGDAWNISIQNALGDEAVRYKPADDQPARTFRAEQIRARGKKGIAFVNTVGNQMTLSVLRGGEDDEPIPVAYAASVTYYIPYPSGSTVSFTQVGGSFSGGGCNVWDHTSGGKMKYAIDIQVSGTSYDEIVASANGTTAGGSSSLVTCNSLDNGSDGTTCSDYSSSCTSSWGNYAVLAHSDGYYTMYDHLERSNFQVTMSGASASAGCWLGDEGHTGYTKGSKGGCGDHLHFQKQSGSSTGSTSVSVSFREDSSITSADCTTKTPTIAALSCSL